MHVQPTTCGTESANGKTELNDVEIAIMANYKRIVILKCLLLLLQLHANQIDAEDARKAETATAAATINRTKLNSALIGMSENIKSRDWMGAWQMQIANASMNWTILHQIFDQRCATKCTVWSKTSPPPPLPSPNNEIYQFEIEEKNVFILGEDDAKAIEENMSAIISNLEFIHFKSNVVGV